jgi:hypothetical protein
LRPQELRIANSCVVMAMVGRSAFMDWVGTRAFIDDSFRRAYGASNASSFGHYLRLEGSGTGYAALGYRRAGAEALFAEQYLDQPVEHMISAAFGEQITRDRIVEVGNLAADDAWSMLALWGEAANDLGGSSEVAVATLTASLRRMFVRIGLPLHILAPASPTRIGTAAADWGSYYLTDPWVCAASIAEGQRAIARFTAGRRKQAA